FSLRGLLHGESVTSSEFGRETSPASTSFLADFSLRANWDQSRCASLRRQLRHPDTSGKGGCDSYGCRGASVCCEFRCGDPPGDLPSSPRVCFSPRQTL